MARPTGRKAGVISTDVSGLHDDDEHDEDDLDLYRPRPPAGDRGWLHPSELSATQGSRPSSNHDGGSARRSPRPTAGARPLQRPLAIAAAIALISGGALLTATFINRAPESDSTALTVTAAASASNDRIVPASFTPVDFSSTDDDGAHPAAAKRPTIDLESVGIDNAVAKQLHAELSPSMPRVQASDADGMREGSGFFVTDDGHLATSAELVAESDYIFVWTDDGGRWPADLVASDPFSDVAVLLVNDAPAAPASFDESDSWLGDYGLTLDHAGDTLAVGQVQPSSTVPASPAGERGDRASRFRISPGLAPGSAIVDTHGSVVGLVNAGSDASEATPAWMVQRVSAELIASGVAVHPWLGADVAFDRTGGVRVTAVVAGSPAEQAGLRSGDHVSSVDGVAIAAGDQFWAMVQQRMPGDTVEFSITRDGDPRTVTVTLAELDR